MPSTERPWRCHIQPPPNLPKASLLFWPEPVSFPGICLISSHCLLFPLSAALLPPKSLLLSTYHICQGCRAHKPAPQRPSGALLETKDFGIEIWVENLCSLSTEDVARGSGHSVLHTISLHPPGEPRCCLRHTGQRRDSVQPCRYPQKPVLS